MLEKKLQEELNRYNQINKYGKTMIMEQNEPPLPPAGDEPPADAGLPPAPGADPLAGGPPVDAGVPPTEMGADMGADAGAPPAEGEEPPPVEPSADDTTEEIDITDLVDMTKNIKQQLDAKNDENSSVIQKMDGAFSKLSELEAKLGQMDNILSKIDELGAKIEQMKPPTPVEELNMRSLDSYPFNQKPSEFFSQKQQEMKASGKNEYVLTKGDVENYGREEISQSFNPEEDDEQESKPVRY
jgi:hypothetical protein